MMRRLIRLYTIIQDHPGAWKLASELLLYLVPHYLGLALPFGFFLSLLFALRKMKEDHEIDSMFAAGFGIVRIMRPFMAVATVLFVIVFVVFAWGKPLARYKYRALLHSPRITTGFYIPSEDKFLNFGRGVFLVTRLQRSAQRFGRFYAFREHPDGAIMVMTARSGQLQIMENAERSPLELRDVHYYMLGSSPATSGRRSVSTMTLDHLRTQAVTGRTVLARPRGKDEREWTLNELFSELMNTAQVKISEKAIKAEISDRLIRCLLILVSPFTAMAFALREGGRKKNKAMIAGLLVMTSYYAVLFAGRWAVAFGSLSSLTGLWLPFAVFCLFTGVFFIHATHPARHGRMLARFFRI